MKLLGVVLLCIASITVFLAVILPVAATRILGLGVFVSVDTAWGRTFYLIFSHPWVSLASGLLILAVFGRGIWKLTRRIPLLRQARLSGVGINQTTTLQDIEHPSPTEVR